MNSRRRAHLLPLLLLATVATGCGEDGGGEDPMDQGDAGTMGEDASSEDTGEPDSAGGTTGDTSDGGPEFIAQPCSTPSPSPYPEGSSYLGVHAGPLNNDLVPCDTATSFAQAWHALRGFGVAQPNTFSPDGATTYVTTSQPTPDACTVHALNAATGAERWCVIFPGAFASSVEVDADGNLYVTGSGGMLSLDSEGGTRWETSFTGPQGEQTLAIGLHFLPSGEIATVTGAGEVALVSRDDGSVLAALDVYDSFGFERIERMGLDLDFAGLLPEAILEDFGSIFGADSLGGLLGIFAGTGDQWTDNTIGVAPDGTIYAIGSGATADNGAVVQIKVDTSGETPRLIAGWQMPTVLGSATSPSISQDGRYVKVADGNTTAALLAPGEADATVRIADVVACDDNTDDDPDPTICQPAVTVPLRSGPALGASPVFDDAEHYVWDV